MEIYFFPLNFDTLFCYIIFSRGDSMFQLIRKTKWQYIFYLLLTLSCVFICGYTYNINENPTLIISKSYGETLVKHIENNSNNDNKNVTDFSNQNVSFYQKYKTIIIGLSIVYALLLLSILLLLINIKKRKKIEISFIKANKELIETYTKLESAQYDLSMHYHELQKSKERYRIIFEATNEVLWDYDIISKDMYFSDKWYDIFEINQENKYNFRAYLKLIHKEDRAFIISFMKNLKHINKNTFDFEFRIQKKEGDFSWIYAKGVIIRDKNDNIISMAGSFSNIHEKKRQQEKIEMLAYYDTLTGLPNRFHLIEQLNQTLNSYRHKQHGISGAVLLIDLDNFKVINDTFGHGVGDLILSELGERLKAAVDDKVFIARLSGDEFVVLIRHTYSKDKINNYIEKIQAIFHKPVDIAMNVFDLTTSIGISLFPSNGATVDDILKNADLAMNRAKEMGRNCYVFYNKSMNNDIYDKLVIQNQLRKALKNNEFKLYYQPQIDIKTNKIYGLEALIRWNSPEFGFVSPGKFIKIAEEMGIIDKIGEWVLVNACRFAKQMNEKYEAPIIISINISALQLMKIDFVNQVKRIIQEANIEPSLVGLEITETALMKSFDVNAKKLKQLKHMGIDISLDDFGTGYSSLNYLTQLPINKLKIDKSFIDTLVHGDNSTNLTENIIIIAHKIGLKVVAEGVEKKEQLDILTSYNCNYVQGYYISKPLSEAHLIEYMGSINKF